MKKILQLFLILLMFPVLVLAESITIENIEVVEKTEGLEIENPVVEGLNININPKFENVGDFVKYKITLKNNEDKNLEAKLANANNPYISYELSDVKKIDKNGDAEVTLLVKYNTLIENNTFYSNDEIGFTFEVESTPVPLPEVPNTMDATMKIAIFVLAISLTAYGITILFYNKKVKYTIPLGIGLLAMCSVFFIGSSHASTILSIKVSTTIEPSNYLYNILLKEETEKDSMVEAKALISTKATPDYSTYSSTDEGLFEIEDDDGLAYYYRGDVNNNHVIFGGVCWRIVRTTGTGGTKLVYNGVPSNGVCNNTGTNTQIESAKFYNEYNSLAYVGYMYGDAKTANRYTINTSGTNIIFSNNATYNQTTGMYELDMDNSFEMIQSNWNSANTSVNYTQVANKHFTCLDNKTSCSEVYYVNTISSSMFVYQPLSNGETLEDLISKMITNSDNSKSSNAKIRVDEWYKNNLINYGTYLEDTIFCNDRSITSYGGWDKDNSNEDAPMYFGPNSRNYNLYKPSLVCPNQNDKFTVNPDRGNGDLTYPVGLLTIDEIALAGGKYGNSNSDYYLYIEESQWTMSPSYFDLVRAGVCAVPYSGNLSDPAVHNTLGLRPVVSLKPGSIVESGNGTTDTPYVIKTN